MELCNLEKCTGCRACENACPRDAITITFTAEYKSVPEINSDLCVNCGVCSKVCPVLGETAFSEPRQCLAAWTRDIDDQTTCASGGIATALYKNVLIHGGVIYGCKYDEELKPIICRSESNEDLERFKSSKYVQSSTEHSYSQVKNDLDKGRETLYIGTPCQIDGLLHFLGKRYDNLYTVDIICHGVPPYKYLQDYVKALNFKEKITSIAFRGKQDYCFSIYNEGKNIYWRYSEFDYYFLSFLRGIIFRDNCYQCNYARKERISDLTIGDFWGLDKKSLCEKYDGKVSVILVNTQKGQELLDRSHEYIHSEIRTLEEAIKYNEQLNHPMPVHADRKIFLNNLNKGVYKALCSTKTGRYITQKRISNKIKKVLKRM